MNPFIHSPVAVPLGHTDEAWQVVPYQAPWQFFKSSRRRFVCLRLGFFLFALVASVNSTAVELNTANLTELQSLKGVGPKTAALIVEERQRGGPFEDLKDLGERVKGLGPKKLLTLTESGLTVVFKPETQPSKKPALNLTHKK